MLYNRHREQVQSISELNYIRSGNLTKFISHLESNRVDVPDLGHRANQFSVQQNIARITFPVVIAMINLSNIYNVSLCIV